MVQVTFKEWAAVCRALADGRQAVILRKGGIAEVGGGFRPDHERFLLYPTFFHEQQQAGLKQPHLPLLAAAEADRPPAGVVRFTHSAEVAGVHFVTDPDRLLGLGRFHVLTADTVLQRFHYRTPGLYVLVVRVYRLPEPVEVADRLEYAGCKTWVELDEPVSTDGSVPVLADEAFQEVVAAVRTAVSRSSS